MPGLGHPVHKAARPAHRRADADRRRRRALRGPHLRLFEAIGRVHPRGARAGRCRSTAPASAVRRWPTSGCRVELLRGFALLARAAGLLGQIAEERRRPIGMDAYLAVDRNAVYVEPARGRRRRARTLDESRRRQRTTASHPAYAEHPDARGGRRPVLVRMTAAPVVPLDLLCASGTSYFGRPHCPTCPASRASASSRASGTRGRHAGLVRLEAGMAPGDGTPGRALRRLAGDVVRLDSRRPRRRASRRSDCRRRRVGVAGLARRPAGRRAGAGAGRRRRGRSGRDRGGPAAAARHGWSACARSGLGRARALAAGADEVVALPDGDAAALIARVPRGAGRAAGRRRRPGLRLGRGDGGLPGAGSAAAGWSTWAASAGRRRRRCPRRRCAARPSTCSATRTTR